LDFWTKALGEGGEEVLGKRESGGREGEEAGEEVEDA